MSVLQMANGGYASLIGNSQCELCLNLQSFENCDAVLRHVHVLRDEIVLDPAGLRPLRLRIASDGSHINEGSG